VQYVLVIHPAEEGGYWAEVPVLEGCFAQGETVEEVLEDARGAITSHLQALEEDGQPGAPNGEGVLIATITVPGRAAV
jgi:predicted RNase H-like HicB family nuclease